MSHALSILPEYGADGQYHGSAYIRLIQPFTHPEVLGKDFIADFGKDLPADAHPDVVIVERGWRPDLSMTLAEDLLQRIQRQRARFWWMVDDNLFDTHPSWETERHLAPLRPIFRLFAREADTVLVSTTALAERLQGMANRVIVLPNLLDERLLSSRPSQQTPATQAPQPNSPLRIAYMGTFTHGPDLAFILPALVKVLSEFPNVHLEILGVSQHLGKLPQLLGNRLQVWQGAPAVYPRFLPWVTRSTDWDIGLAPLMRNAFNDNKSDIKILDYAACGSVTICSAVPAYQQSGPLAGGLLCGADMTSWEDALAEMLNDPALRHARQEKARTYLLEHRTLAAAGGYWRRSLRSAFLNDPNG